MKKGRAPLGSPGIPWEVGTVSMFTVHMLAISCHTSHPEREILVEIVIEIKKHVKVWFRTFKLGDSGIVAGIKQKQLLP